MGAALRRLDALAGEEALPKDAEKLRRRVQAAEKENALLREQILEKQDAAPEPAFLNVKLMMPSVLGEANDVIWMSRKPMTKSRFLEVAQAAKARGIVQRITVDMDGDLVVKEVVVPLDEVELEDGATYVMVADFVMPEVTGWISNQVKSFEHSVAELALLYMLQDHPDAQRLCQNKFFSTDGKIELDTVIVAPQCVMLVEVESSLSAAAVKAQVDKALETIRRLVTDDPDGRDAAVFRGKQVKVGLAGSFIAARERGPLKKLADSRGWPVFLPGGTHLTQGNSCFVSDVALSSCAADESGSATGSDSGTSGPPAAVCVLRSKRPGPSGPCSPQPLRLPQHQHQLMGGRAMQHRGLNKHRQMRAVPCSC